MRSRFRSITGLFRAPGSLAVGWISRQLGMAGALGLGLLAYAAQATAFALARTGLHCQLAAPSYRLRHTIIWSGILNWLRFTHDFVYNIYIYNIHTKFYNIHIICIQNRLSTFI
jgi:hypothetical protein